MFSAPHTKTEGRNHFIPQAKQKDFVFTVGHPVVWSFTVMCISMQHYYYPHFAMMVHKEAEADCIEGY